MRKIFLLLALVISVSTFAQEKRKWKGNYLLTGTVEYLQAGEATLSYLNNTRRGTEEIVKTGAIADGKFGFSDYIEEPALATLKIGENEYSLYIDPVQMKVDVISKDEINISGSWSNDDRIKIERLDERISELADEGKKNPQGNLAELSYASVTKDSFVVLSKMLEVANPEHPYHSDVRSKQMIGILMNMSSDLKDTPTGVRASEALFISSVKMYTPSQQ